MTFSVNFPFPPHVDKEVKMVDEDAVLSWSKLEGEKITTNKE